MIDSITIIRNGYIVTDAYLNPLFSSGLKHHLQSCTKSITSALMGIAIDRQYVESVDQKVIDLFSAKTFSNMDERKKAITIRHLLTMSHGIRTLDSFVYKWQGLVEMMKTKDWVQFILDQPMDVMPGKRWDYSNMSSFLLSAIIHEKSGMSALHFASRYLFEPLGITDAKWPANPNGITKGWGELWLTPHDMAKIGWLYLNKGYWENKQIISAQWIEDSIEKIAFPKAFRKVIGQNGKLMLYRSIWVRLVYKYFLFGTDAYGYQWWIDDSGLYLALGNGGQYIIVVPGKNMVVVFTSALKPTHIKKPGLLVGKYIIPSISSNHAIAPNTAEFKRLKALSKSTGGSSKPVDVAFLPEMAQEVSGRTYMFNDNWLGFKSLSLSFQPDQNVATGRLQILPMGLDNVLQIGLDNVYRFTDIDGTQAAFKGHWINENTFVISYELIGNIHSGTFHIEFEDHQITQTMKDNMLGEMKFIGHAEE